MLEHDLRDALPQVARETDSDARATLRIAVNANTLSTWFVTAMAQFTRNESALLDIALDDQEHTVEWLRTGQVLAAVTSHAQAVQGCNSVPLGKLRYLAVASPQFVKRHFNTAVDATSLSRAPSLRFNPKDLLQAIWMRRLCRREIQAPAHWLPSTQAFVDAAIPGVGWAMNPASLIRPHLKSGALVELVADRPLFIPLYWQHTRLQVPMLDRLTAGCDRNGPQRPAVTVSVKPRKSPPWVMRWIAPTQTLSNHIQGEDHAESSRHWRSVLQVRESREPCASGTRRTWVSRSCRTATSRSLGIRKRE